MEITSSLLTEGWDPMGDDSDSNFQKVHLYTMNWNQQALPMHISDFIIAAAPFGGPLALLRQDRKSNLGGYGQMIQIFSASGNVIKSLRWEGPHIVKMGWSTNEELICVPEEGHVQVFPLDLHILQSQKSFSMLKDMKGHQILDVRIFNTLCSKSTGVAVLTDSYKFFIVKNINDARSHPLADIGLTKPPSAWDVVSNSTETNILVSHENCIYILGLDRSSRRMQVHFNAPTSDIIEIAVSFDHQRIALFGDNGHVWMGKSDLSGKEAEYDSENKSRPKLLVWCGQKAVAAYSHNILKIIGYEHYHIDHLFMEPTIHVVPEPDGCRVVTSTQHLLIKKVPEVVNDVCRFGSFVPGRILLEACQYYKSGRHTADEYLHSLKSQDQLPVAVNQCIDAAGRVFNVDVQKALLKAASFGKVFLDEQIDNDKYMLMCQLVRVLNALRSPELGLPLTYRQFKLLGAACIIDKLILRQHWPIALEISKFLKLKLENKILVHWACFKVQQKHLSTDKIAAAIGERLRNNSGIQYSEIANRANELGRKDLAVKLLDYEPRSTEQIPLLLKLEKPLDALNKAIESGDADLVHRAIAYMQVHSASKFLLELRHYPLAVKYYHKTCTLEKDKLEDLLDQEILSDSHVELARLRLEESLQTDRKEQKLTLLRVAGEKLKKVQDKFGATICEQQVALMMLQTKLEKNDPGARLFGKSLNQTLRQVMRNNDMKTAEAIKKEFLVPDRRYMWLHAQVLASENRWADLEKLSAQKKVPLIGFEAFADLCLDYNQKNEAMKYILKLKDDSKVNYILRFNDNDFMKAAEFANAHKDMQSLEILLDMTASDPKTVPVAEKINGFIGALRR